MKINSNAVLFLLLAIGSLGAGLAVITHSGWPLIATTVIATALALTVDVDGGER